MIGSFPLPKDHWIYSGDRTETYGTFNTPPMVFKMGRAEQAMIVFGDDVLTVRRILEARTVLGQPPHPQDVAMNKQVFADKIREAGKYAIRCATMNGKDMDFDPDALLQNLVTGFLGYHTENGLSDDEWANPRQFQKNPEA